MKLAMSLQRQIAVLCVACALCAACGEATRQSPPRVTAYPQVSGLDLSQARSFDNRRGESGTIRYTLSAPAKVRLRLVDSATPGIVLRTLLDWEPRPEGGQAERWDGKDGQGEATDPRRVSVALQAEPLLEGLDAASRATLAGLPHPEHKHFLHPLERCHDLGVHLSAPGPGVAVSGQVSVTASLTEWLGMPAGEYHAVLYLDGRMAWDGRVKEPRLAQTWDTRNTTDGEHWLAVTFNDLHDHAGSDWQWVTVDNEGRTAPE